MILEELKNTVLSLPFQYYHQFVIEQNFGFNKQTLSIFVTDIIKTYLLTISISTIFFSSLNWIISTFQETFILYAWLLSIILMLGLLVIYPIFIQPLFNKYLPLDTNDPKEKQIKSEVEELCKELNFPLHKLLKVDSSRRTAHSNAYFFGLFNKKRIVLFDNLIN